MTDQIECTNPEGHLWNKWAIEGGAVCSICGAKLSLGETLTMLCEHAALKRENIEWARAYKLLAEEQADAYDAPLEEWREYVPEKWAERVDALLMAEEQKDGDSCSHDA